MSNEMAYSKYPAPRNLSVAPAAREFRTGAKRLSEEAAAKYLGVPRTTLVSKRRRGNGPKSYWHMGRVAYDVTELDAFKVAA